MDEAQLRDVERLASIRLGGANDPNTSAADAEAQLLRLESSSEYVPQCQFILDNTASPFAQHIASHCLESLMTKFWNNFSVEQKLEIRNYVLMFLHQRTTTLDNFVIKKITTLFCRVTKLGWFDGVEHRDIINDVQKFVEGTIDHHIIGLEILNALIQEMNIQNPNRTLTQHRKTAVSFRDHALYPAFTMGISTLKNLQMGAIQVPPGKEKSLETLAHSALTLSTLCLSFDFIGTNPEESGEDISTVQVPTAWRPAIQDVSTMQLFFDFYQNTRPPQSDLALKSLVQLSSVRRSLFSSDTERTAFLHALMAGTFQIMDTQAGLDEDENYHEYCRLLGRLKTSYQLVELVRTPNFTGWLNKARDFTLETIRQWDARMNSIHYLLAMWSRMVAALPYLKTDLPEAAAQAQVLRSCVMNVVEFFIRTMLESSDAVAIQGYDDPLEDEGSLKDTMERLPVVARLQYGDVSAFLIQNFDFLLGQYSEIVTLAPQQLTQDVINNVKAVEGKLTWLMQIIAACIGTPGMSGVSVDLKKNQTELLSDGNLCRLGFRLVELIDTRMNSTQGQSKCDVKLELAVLQFFKNFKKVYMNDHHSSTSSTYNGSISVPGRSAAHPLLRSALSAPIDREDQEDKENVDIYGAIGQGVDVNFIMKVMIEKLCNNVKFWQSSDKVLDETLEVFVDFVSNYHSSKTLLGLDTVNFMVTQHTGEFFPFLGYDNDNKHRTTFYSALSRLVFSSSEDLNNCFDQFIQPNLDILAQLTSLPDDQFTQAPTRCAIVGALRDLRGIAVSAYSRRTYALLFDALYPTCFPLFTRIAETWFSDAVVMTALLKFVQEFVQNKGQRIFFEQSSANGILLFRETSSILCAYGSRILQVETISDVYKEKYKGIRVLLDALTFALSGNYVNFGVFALYNDRALQNSLDVSLQLCLSIPLEEVMAYPKLSKAYFSYLEILFRHHLDVLAGLDSATFNELIRKNNEGLQCGDTAVICVCAMTIDHIATFLFLNQNRTGKPTYQRIQGHVLSDPTMLDTLMNTLFSTLLFSSAATCWPLTRPILSVMLASRESFSRYIDQLASSQSPENQQLLRIEVEKIHLNVQESLDTPHRDKFTSKLTAFRLALRNFLNL